MFVIVGDFSFLFFFLEYFINPASMPRLVQGHLLNSMTTSICSIFLIHSLPHSFCLLRSFACDVLISQIAQMLLDAGCLKSICDRGRLETEGWGPVVYTNADGHFKSELEPFEVIRALSIL
jgi:hypothetical protein